MRSKLFNFVLLLCTAVFLTSCFNEGGDVPVNNIGPAVDMNSSKATPEHGKMIIDESIYGVLGNDRSIKGMEEVQDYLLSMVDETREIMDGLTAVVTVVNDDPYRFMITFEFDECPGIFTDSVVNGVMTVLVTNSISDNAMMVVVNTEDGDLLTLTGGELDNSIIQFKDLTVIYEFDSYTHSYSGVIVVNGEEHSMNDFLSPKDIMDFLADAMNRVNWDEIKNQLVEIEEFIADSFMKKSIDKFSLFDNLFSPLTIYITEGLRIDMSFNFDFSNPAIILELTFDEFPLSIENVINETISGSMNIVVRIEDISELKMKLSINTDENNPLILSGSLGEQTIGLEDIILHIQPELSGKIILNGIELPLDSEWISYLLSLLSSIF
ncbi:MAG: hypothetical protein SVZ03_11565 [Spirochaetota bacterium]|nr:hypothetical protein [Spirochaetota bacterium]